MTIVYVREILVGLGDNFLQGHRTRHGNPGSLPIVCNTIAFRVQIAIIHNRTITLNYTSQGQEMSIYSQPNRILYSELLRLLGILMTYHPSFPASERHNSAW